MVVAPAVADGTAAGRLSSESAGAHWPMAQARQVVIVEDDEACAAVLAGFFERIGLNPVVHTDSRTALPDALSGATCLISLDLTMPNFDGFDMLLLIRSHEHTQRLAIVPVMAITGRASLEDRAHSIASGFAAHLVKPVQFSTLLSESLRTLSLRAKVYGVRHSCDHDGIMARAAGLTAGLSATQSGLLLQGMVLALRSQGFDHLRQMALGVYGDAAGAMAASDELMASVEAFAAHHLTDLCERFQQQLAAGADALELETGIVMIRAEFDRVSLALREQAMAYPSAAVRGPPPHASNPLG